MTLTLMLGRKNIFHLRQKQGQVWREMNARVKEGVVCIQYTYIRSVYIYIHTQYMCTVYIQDVHFLFMREAGEREGCSPAGKQNMRGRGAMTLATTTERAAQQSFDALHQCSSDSLYT